jgi:hypothetical protein
MKLFRKQPQISLGLMKAFLQYHNTAEQLITAQQKLINQLQAQLTAEKAKWN